MPYATIQELPDSVQGVLPKRAQEVFLRIVNRELDKGTPESQAFAYGWTGVKNGWEKNEQTGQWHRKTDAAAIATSPLNAAQLDALTASEFQGGCENCGWGELEAMATAEHCPFCAVSLDE